MRGWKIAGSLVVIVALAAIGAWWWSQKAPDAMADARVGATPANTEAAQAPPIAATPAVPSAAPPAPAASAPATLNDTPLPAGPIGTTYAELVRRAEAGDGRAAMALARTLALCESYVEEEREVLEEDLVTFAANVQDTPDPAGGASSRDRFVELAVGAIDIRAATCPGIDALGIADRTAERERWFALGLQLGHPAALVEEADAMIRKKYPRRADIVDNAEELRALRPQAMAMLQRAAAQGEPTALLRTSAAHRSGDLAERDPVAAYAYLLAYRAGPPADGVPALFLGNAERHLSAGMTPEQIQAAQARAEQIRAACCGED